MEVLAEQSPIATKEIAALQETVQAFINQHQHGKGDARLSVIPALKDFLELNFQSVDAAYAKIFEVIDSETTKPYKKVPKMFGYLSGLRTTLQANQKLYHITVELDQKEKARKAEAERLQRELEAARAKPAQVVEKVVEVKVPAAAAVQAEEKKSRKRSGSTVSKSKYQEAERKLAEEKQRAQELEQRLKAEKEQNQRLQSGKQLDAVEEQRRMRELEEQTKAYEKKAKKLEETLEDEKLAAKREQTRLQLAAEEKRLADLNAAEEQRKKDLERQQKEHAEQLKKENAKTVEALEKATQAEEEKLKVAQTKYEEGFEKGEAAGDVKGQTKVFLALKNVAQADEDFAEALQKHREHFSHLAGGRLLLGPARADSMQSFHAEMPSAQSRFHQKTKQATERKIVSTKSNCIDYLTGVRAQFIGKHSDTAEEKKQNAISLAAIEYFICLLKLHENDKTLAAIHTDLCDFMRAANIDCPVIFDMTCDASEQVSLMPLTKEQAQSLMKLFQQNPFGFDPQNIKEAIGVFEKYTKENKLVDAERRLKQIFTRAIESSMIETWLGSKYAVVQKLVNLCREYGQKEQTPQNLAVIEAIKIAVLLLVALKGTKTTAELLDSNFIKNLPTPVLAAIQSQVEIDGGNEQINSAQLNTTEFAVFAALFQSTKFFVFSDVNIYKYFNSEGKSPDLKSCLGEINRKLQELTTAQLAPRGSSAMYKPEPSKSESSSKAAATVPKAPLVDAGVNFGAK